MLQGSLSRLLLLGIAAACPVLAEEERPNVVLIVIDDAGYGDLACYGAGDVATPNLDALAAAGVRFTQAYVAAPACSPSRAGLLTGRHPAELGHEQNINRAHQDGPERDIVGLPRGVATIAEALRSRGYRTGLVGKWHLGSAEPFHPQARGFDEFVGFLHGPRSSYAAEARGHVLERGREAVTWEGHLSDTLTAEAVSFIERGHEDPFFLVFSHPLPHAPAEPKPELVPDKQAGVPRRRRIYAGAMRTVDESIGVLLETLRAHELEEDTLVVFLSDNGATPTHGGRNTPFSGHKGALFEGALRVPMIVSWPGRVAAGRVYEPAVSALDVPATVLAAAGVEARWREGIAGVDLLPLLDGDAGARPHEALYWRFRSLSAIRAGRWKLTLVDDSPASLFDLEADPSEQHNQLKGEPAIAADLTGRLESWRSKLPEPLWLDNASKNNER